jgi:transcription antitermination protein NusB
LSRRQARELALQVLFQVDLGHTDPDTALFQAFSREQEGDHAPASLLQPDAQYARDLVQGTWERKEALDELITSLAVDWTIERMPVIDRNLLRMAIYEIKHQPDVPNSVVADEAVELAKAYSTPDSAKFINGILGNVIRGGEPLATEG